MTQDRDDWSDIKMKKKKMLAGVVERLPANEQQLLARVLDFEVSRRHLVQPTYKKELREIVEQVIRDDS